MLSLPEGMSGVLPEQHLHKAIDAHIITAGDFSMPHDGVQPASVDLRLGETAYRIRSSFLPGDDSVERKMKTLKWGEASLRGEGTLLEKGRPYLIKLK
ncbi:MAG: 2'-deoxycytidine 5'-triphosphate deaminase domain-containing protein, partial [Acidimicrobiales bacterium]